MPTPSIYARLATRVQPAQRTLEVAFFAWFVAFFGVCGALYFFDANIPRPIVAALFILLPLALVSIILVSVSGAFHPTDGRFAARLSSLPSWAVALTLDYLLVAIVWLSVLLLQEAGVLGSGAV